MLADCHAHAWDATCRILPRDYAPAAPVPREQFLQALDAAGAALGVLVQPSFLGTDNAYLLAALRAHPARLRGVVVIDGTLAPDDLAAMDAAGVRGIRFNLMAGRRLPDLAGGGWPVLLRAMGRLGWHVQVNAPGPDWPGLLPPLLATGLPLVIDHFGQPDPARGTGCPGLAALLAAARTSEVWVKLSAPYRLGGVPPRPLAEAWLEAVGPERAVWGSDFPFTRHEAGRDHASELAAARHNLPVAPEALGNNARRLYRA